MEPFSYQGFGFTAILLMIAVISAGQLFRYLKERGFQSKSATEPVVKKPI